MPTTTVRQHTRRGAPVVSHPRSYRGAHASMHTAEIRRKLEYRAERRERFARVLREARGSVRRWLRGRPSAAENPEELPHDGPIPRLHGEHPRVDATAAFERYEDKGEHASLGLYVFRQARYHHQKLGISDAQISVDDLAQSAWASIAEREPQTPGELQTAVYAGFHAARDRGSAMIPRSTFRRYQRGEATPKTSAAIDAWLSPAVDPDTWTVKGSGGFDQDGSAIEDAPYSGKVPAVNEDDEAETRSDVRAGFAMLPTDQREALRLRYDGNDWETVADKLGVSRRTAIRRHDAGLKLLRKLSK